jgi:hypothetical protein
MSNNEPLFDHDVQQPELPQEQPEQLSVISRVEQHALPAFIWWVGSGLVLSFVTFVASETMYLLVLWSVTGLLAALVMLFIAAYRVYSAVVEMYHDVQEMLHELAHAVTDRQGLNYQAISPLVQPMTQQPMQQQSSLPVFDRDGVAIQFSEIFKEL